MPDRTQTILVELESHEVEALRHELSEPYGRDIRIGILGKLRDSLAQRQEADPRETGTWPDSPSLRRSQSEHQGDEGSGFEQIADCLEEAREPCRQPCRPWSGHPSTQVEEDEDCDDLCTCGHERFHHDDGREMGVYTNCKAHGCTCKQFEAVEPEEFPIAQPDPGGEEEAIASEAEKALLAELHAAEDGANKAEAERDKYLGYYEVAEEHATFWEGVANLEKADKRELQTQLDRAEKALQELAAELTEKAGADEELRAAALRSGTAIAGNDALVHASARDAMLKAASLVREKAAELKD